MDRGSKLLSGKVGVDTTVNHAPDVLELLWTRPDRIRTAKHLSGCKKKPRTRTSNLLKSAPKWHLFVHQPRVCEASSFFDLILCSVTQRRKRAESAASRDFTLGQRQSLVGLSWRSANDFWLIADSKSSNSPSIRL